MAKTITLIGVAPADIGLGRVAAGVGWMLASGLSFVAVNAIVRHLGTDLPAPQSAFLRFAFGCVFLTPALPALIRAGLPAGSLPLFVGRGLAHMAAVIFWFYAMARIPVAEVTAIGYLNPVLVTLGGAVLLREGLSLRRIAAIGVAVLGAGVILRPGLRAIEPGHLSQLCAATCFAASYLGAKRLSAVAGPATIVAMMSAMVTLGLLPIALWVWQPVSAAQLGWLALTAVFATAAHYFMTRAFRVAPLSVTQPVTFLQLVWATILGAVVFGEAIDGFVLLGGAMIIGAISLSTWAEARVARDQARNAPVADAPV